MFDHRFGDPGGRLVSRAGADRQGVSHFHLHQQIFRPDPSNKLLDGRKKILFAAPQLTRPAIFAALQAANFILAPFERLC
jgi:hypothetical protein